MYIAVLLIAGAPMLIFFLLLYILGGNMEIT